MGRRLSKAEFHQKHKPIIELAQQKLSVAEIAKQTRQSESMVSFITTTARQRGISIPYQRKQKRNVSKARESLKTRLRELLGGNIKRLNYRQASRMFEQGLSIDAVANEIATQLNIPSQKANTIAQTIYYLRKMK